MLRVIDVLMVVCIGKAAWSEEGVTSGTCDLSKGQVAAEMLRSTVFASNVRLDEARNPILVSSIVCGIEILTVGLRSGVLWLVELADEAMAYATGGCLSIWIVYVTSSSMHSLFASPGVRRTLVVVHRSILDYRLASGTEVEELIQIRL